MSDKTKENPTEFEGEDTIGTYPMVFSDMPFKTFFAFKRTGSYNNNTAERVLHF